MYRISTKLSLLNTLTLLVLIVQPNLSASATEISFPSPTPPTVTKFLTARETQSFYRRDLGDGNVFYPRKSAVIEYGNENSPTNAVVSFDASDTPIVVARAFESFLESIECTPTLVPGTFSTISILFDSQESANEASRAWRSFKRVNFLTSHPGCNVDNSFGAWRIHEIETNAAAPRIKLVAESIALNQLGAYNVLLLGHSMSGEWQPEYNTRSDLTRREIFNPSYSNDFSGLEIISANTSSLPSSLQDELENANLNIVCLECSVNFNFTVDVNITVSFLNVTAMSITATVDNFNQTILLGFSVGVTGLSFSHDRDLFNLPLTPLAIRDLLSIGPEVGISAGLDLNLTGEMNFTMGTRATIDPGAWASFDFLNQTETNEGWDSAKLESIPLRLLGGNLNSSFTMNISPFIGLGITLPFDDQPFIEGRVSQNAPTINISANMTENVNRNCEPITDNDFESFPVAFKLSGDMTFATHVGLLGDLADLFPPWDEEFPHGTFELFNRTSQSSTGSQCLVVVDDAATGANATAPSILTAAPTGTLMAAASAVPSFDVSKIQSYFSANGQLPTNVDYSQLIQATTVPDDIKNAVQGAARPTPSPSVDGPGNPGKSAASKLRLGFVHFVSPWSLTVVAALYSALI